MQAAPLAPEHEAVISVRGLTKTYAGGFTALNDVSLEIRRGEIFALLGPNGAGKTTLIGIVCGLVNRTSGEVRVAGRDVVADYRQTRAMVGLVPQELHTEAFERVWDTVLYSRGLFGKARDDAYLERVLKDLSLWDKRSAKIITLSGGMKRRVMIAKALAHEPEVLFLDEPTAGVDVELRRDLWRMVRGLAARGVTIILTTHYIEEAEELADRIGVIHKGEIILVEETRRLMQQLGKKELVLQLAEPLAEIPPALAGRSLALASEGHELVYTYDSQDARTGIGALIRELGELGIGFRDLHTTQSSLEEIFVELVRSRS